MADFGSEKRVRVAVDSTLAERGVAAFRRGMDQMSGSASTASRSIVRSFGRVGSSLTSLRGFAAQVATALVLRNSIRESVDFEKALVGVGKTANISGKDLSDLGKAVTELSLKIPVSTAELLEIAQSAGQLGVQGSENILKFSETVAKLGRATNLSGEEAATTLARLLNVTHESVDTVDTLGSVIVRLGNNFAATEREIALVGTQVAQSSNSFKVSSAEAVGLGTAMAALGVRAELAGTAVGRSMRAIDKAIRGGGASLNNLVKLTGIAGDEIKKQFGEDAVGVFQKFVEGIGKVQRGGGDVAALLKSFGLEGQEVLKVLPTLASRSDLLADALDNVHKELKNVVSLDQEFSRSAGTLDSELNLMRNTIRYVERQLGDELAPAIRKVSEYIRELPVVIPQLKRDFFGLVRDVKTTFANIEEVIKVVAISFVTQWKTSINNIKGEWADFLDLIVKGSKYIPEAVRPDLSGIENYTKKLREQISNDQKFMAGEFAHIREEANAARKDAADTYKEQIALLGDEAKATALSNQGHSQIKGSIEGHADALDNLNAATDEMIKKAKGVVATLKAQITELSKGADAALRLRVETELLGNKDAAHVKEAKKLVEVLIQQREAVSDLKKELAEEEKKRGEAKQIIEQSRTPLEKYNAELAKYKDLAKEGYLNQDQLTHAINAAKKEYEGANKDIAADLKNAIQGFGKETTDALVDLVSTGKGSFKDLADSIIKDINRIIIQRQLIDPLVNSITGTDSKGNPAKSGGILSGLFGAFSGSGGSSGASAGGGGGFFSGLTSLFGGFFGGGGDLVPTPMAAGGIMSPFGPIRLQRYQTGGIATKPSLAVYGEGSRNEAIVPLPDGRSIPVIQKGGSSPPITVNVTFHVVAPNGQIPRETQSQIATRVGTQVNKAVARNG